MNTRNGIDIQPGKHSLSAYEISKKVFHLFRHSQQVRERMERFISGELKNIFRVNFYKFFIGLTTCGKAYLAAGGAKRRFQYCTDESGTNCLFPSSSRTFRTQSYWSFIAGQCCNSERSLPTSSPCWVCVQSSFCHQLWITSRSASKRQKYSFCLLILETKSTRILKRCTCTTSCTTLAQRKRHQDAVYWVDINLNSIECNFKEHFQLIVFQKLSDWRLEKS